MNAIVYSVYVDNGNLLDNYNFEQLKTSLATLRKFNLDIPVKVYISAPEANDIEFINNFNDDNLEFIRFDLKFDKRLTGGIYTKWTAHKWRNTLDALKRFNFDNVLYIDTDTFFQKDPHYLFDKYGNTPHVWGKPDVEKFWPEKFNLDYLGMNDGQQILSRHTVSFLQDLIDARDNLVYELQEKYKDKDDEKLHIAIQYIYGQYAVSEFLKSINNPLYHFDDEDVLVLIDPNLFDSLPNKNNIALVHFCNINMQRFDPNAFKIYQNNNLGGK